MATAKERRKNFVNRANKLHNNKYNYSHTEYNRNTDIVTIICPSHGPFELYAANHVSTRKKHGCPECYAERRSDSVEFVRSEIIKRGGTLLDPMNNGKSYIKSEARIQVQCDGCKKIWTPKWRSLKVNNRWCSICTKKYGKSISFESLEALANEVGGTVIRFPDNPIPSVNATDEIDYKCNGCNKIQYNKKVYTLNNRKNTHSVCCEHCGRFQLSKTFEEVRTMVEDESYTLIEFPDNGLIKKVKTKDYITVQCDNGHESYRVRLHNWRTGKRCPLCRNEKNAATSKLEKEEIMRRIIESHGDRYEYPNFKDFEYLGKEQKIAIICAEHGEFVQRIDCHSRRGSGCPMCNSSIGENLLRKLLEEKYNKPFTSVRHPKIVNPRTGRALELDCYNEELNLAFEYQGRQHYEPIDFFGGHDAYEERVYRDQHKKRACQELGIRLVEIDGRDINSIQSIERKKKSLQNLLRSIDT